MRIRVSSVVLLTLALSWTALAQTSMPMREGNWSVTVKMSMEGMKMDMPPMTRTQCITEAMAKDPQASLPKGPEGSDCKVTDYKNSGGTVAYKMVCTKPNPMTATAELKFNGTDAYTGTMAMETQGHKMSMAMDAKRLGDCPK